MHSGFAPHPAPAMAVPRSTAPQLPAPHFGPPVAAPHAATPQLASPHMAQPHIATPQTATPQVVLPRAVPQVARWPAVAAPGIATQRFAHPLDRSHGRLDRLHRHRHGGQQDDVVGWDGSSFWPYADDDPLN
jgi:hypothetical protein